MAYNPQDDGIVVSKPIAPIGFPVDSRSTYYDATTLSRRPFVSTAEVLAYFDTAFKRSGSFSILIDDGSDVVKYWFKDTENLVLENVSGVSGQKGWSPVHGVANRGADKVIIISDFVGGEGDKPASEIGKYLGSSGYVVDIADAIALPKGADGSNGTNGTNGSRGEKGETGEKGYTGATSATGLGDKLIELLDNHIIKGRNCRVFIASTWDTSLDTDSSVTGTNIEFKKVSDHYSTRLVMVNDSSRVNTAWDTLLPYLPDGVTQPNKGTYPTGWNSGEVTEENGRVHERVVGGHPGDVGHQKIATEFLTEIKRSYSII